MKHEAGDRPEGSAFAHHCVCGRGFSSEVGLALHVTEAERHRLRDDGADRETRPEAMCCTRVMLEDGGYGFCDMAAGHERLNVPHHGTLSMPPPPSDFGPRRK